MTVRATRYARQKSVIASALIMLAGFGELALAVEPQVSGPPTTAVEGTAGNEDAPVFGGAASVNAQVQADHRAWRTQYRFEGFSRHLQPYYDFKARIKKEHSLAFGADYNALYQGANQSLGEDRAAGGVVRLYGNWTLIGQGTPDTGSLVFKVENRHRLGTDIAPQELAGEIGYAGLTAITFSDAGLLLTNLYWHQTIKQGRAAFIAGIVDVTDYVDVYALINPWTDFINLAFNTDPTIPAPDQGLGAAVRMDFLNNYYLVAGLADANGDPGNPGDSFDSFFNDHEYFKHVELGWFSSWQNRSTDNIHLTAWQVDEREMVQVDDGWGLAFSFSQKIGQRWLPFIRAGYSDGGGAPLDRSVSAGLGYFRQERSDVLGIGINWGRPAEEIYGAGLDDQYTTEVFYRLQAFPHLTITPDLQLLVNPVLNPEEDRIWVAGLRMRLSF
jgi:porin